MSTLDEAVAALKRRDFTALEAHCDALIEAGSADIRPWFWRANLHKDAGEPDPAIALYEHVVARAPGHAPSWFNLGALRLERGDAAQASRDLLTALRARPDHRGTVLLLGEALLASDQRTAADQLFHQAHQRGLLAHPLQRPTTYQPGLTARPWWDPAEIQGLDAFIDAFEVLRDELLAALHQRRQWHSKALAEGRWDKLFFAFRGQPNPAARQACPTVASLLDAVELARRMTTGNHTASILAPHTHISAHCGPTNQRLRAHLGIQIPPGCLLTVAGEARPWREGEWLLFDDSFEHEALNPTDQDRVVLIVDLHHPELAGQ